MQHPNSLDLLTYWTARRGSRPCPSCAEMEPSAISKILPHVFIAERREDDGTMIFRLAGTAICLLFGRELKTTPLSELWLREGRRNASGIAQAVTAGKPGVLSLDGLSKGGRTIRAEMLLLPVTGAMTGPATGISGQVNRIFGALSLFEPPCWIGHDPLAGLSTTRFRLQATDRQGLHAGNRAYSRADTRSLIATPYTLPSPLFGQRRSGHLSVMDGGRKD